MGGRRERTGAWTSAPRTPSGHGPASTRWSWPATRRRRVPDDVALRRIWSNPPIRIGKAALHDLLPRWLDRLAPGRTAWLVVAEAPRRRLPRGVVGGRGLGHRAPRRRAGYRLLAGPAGRREASDHVTSPTSAAPSSSASTATGGDRTDGRLALLLDGVQNPFNVGAILRTAAAFSVDHLWLVGRRLAHRRQGPEDARSAPSASAPGPTRDLRRGRRPRTRRATGSSGVELADGAPRRSTSSTCRGACASPIGHEDRGLSKELPRRCDDRRLPPPARPHRLAQRRDRRSIACYEARAPGAGNRRRRRTPDPSCLSARAGSANADGAGGPAQRRRGSTSTRRRPGGRVTAARASQQRLVVGGPQQPLAVGGPEHLDAAAGRRSASTNAGADGPDTTAIAVAGG